MNRMKQAGWSILSIFAAIFGLLLIFKSLDTLLAWRAWVFLMCGLILCLLGIGSFYLRFRRRDEADAG